MRKIIGKKNKVHYVEETTRFQMVKSHKGWLVIGASMFALGLGVLVTSRPVSADVAATSTSSSAVRAETTGASSSSATNADSTSANNSSAVKAETTSASSSSATNAETTGASSSSEMKADSTSTNNSSAVKAETTSASSSSATNAETTGASSSSEMKADSTSANNSSAVNAETTGASSSSATNAETTGASSSSATNAETTGASSSSEMKADSTSTSSSSAVKAETTSASSSSAVKTETTSESSSSAVKTETTSASSSSEMKADSTSTSSSSAAKADVTSADGKQRVAQIATNDSKNSAIVTTKFAQNYGRKVLAGSVTNTGFSVSDPDYPSGMWIDPDNSHYSYRWVQAKQGGKQGGKQIVFSTNRTGDGIVYVTELSKSNEVLKQYTLNQNTQVESAIFDSTIYYNDVYFEMVRSSSNSFVTKYTASKFDNNYYNTLSYFVPKLITQTTYYVDKDGKQIIDSNGNPVAAYTQKGLVGQNYTTSDVTVVNGYYAIAPANSNGVMSPYGKIGASYVKNFHDGVVITYTQTGSDGTMSASIAQNGSVLETWTSIKPSDPTIMKKLGYTTYGIKNPYIPQTSDIKYVYNKLGNWIVYNPDGSTTSRIYPNDPSNPTKIADSSVPDYPVIAFIPGYIPEDHMGTPLVPVDPDDRTKGYIPPTPSDIGKDTTITYTADKQEGSVSYVDDTTGKTLKTDSISGTTGSKSSYSTSGSIADYKKHGYELVTDGYPVDLTFDNDDTTDQNFTVHLKHQLTPVNPTNPQTPGAPINPDEPDGPKWPTSTNYDKTVNETVSYVDQNGHVVAKQHTDSVNFTRTVVVDNVTGEVITSGAGTTAWTATNGDTTFDAVVSPVVSGSVANKAQTAAVTDLNANSADVNETVTYTKVGSLVPSSSDGNFPGAPTVVYPNDPSDATKVTPAGVPTVPGYTAHDPEGHVLTPGSSYQPSNPTKDTTITYTADKQEGSVSYVDDTTGKTLKTDSISGTTGSKSSYSTSGNIADYKKHGYELVTDGYPVDLTFDNDDTTDQNFTVHLKHQLTPVNPTNPQTPGAPINPDEPDGPKWPTSTNYDKTVNETVSYVDQNGHVVAKQHTDSVNFTRTVVVDNVTGEVITSGAGTTAWTATNGDTTFDAVVSPVVSGSVANKAQTAAVTDLNANSADVNETVTYTKVGSLVPSSSDGNFPGAPTVVYPNDPSDATKVTPAGVPTVPGYTAHDPEGHVLTPGSSYQPSNPTKDTTITYTADKQEGSVSYVDDTTGKTLKTDSISGTTGSKSSYSTSGNIADYKKHGYELVTDGYPVDLTFDNDDTTDQNFTVHLKHQNIQSTEAKTVTETIHYQGAGNQTPADNTTQVTFTRQVSTDTVTGEKTYGSWSADQSFAAVTSPVIKGYTPDQAEIGAQTVSGNASDLDFTVIYTKDAPTKPVNPSQPTTPAKPVQAGQAAATNFVDQRLPQTGETDQQHITLSGLLLLAMSSVLGLFGMTKRQRKE
ncbi:mucin-binding protein [Lactococcus cremoris]|uniref:mucin-binding protein n=1 Tax=Lactococcus lactis subsp. cremoris TaxID=1359 RepID=UPI0014871518|nr:LPXTG cell wall anchor domain-containing protein [Lactococcus cremoris]